MNIDDAARYQWLKSKLLFSLQSHNGPNYLENATWSLWSAKTTGIFEGTTRPPESIDIAIDAAMRKEIDDDPEKLVHGH